MNSLVRAIVFLGGCVLAAVIYATFSAAVVEMYPTAQAAETARYLADQRTQTVQAQQWGATMRSLGESAAVVAAWAAVAAASIVAAVQWGRTLRHRDSEQSRRVALLMLYAREALPPGARVEVLPYRGELVLCNHDAGEIIPYPVARAELAQRRLLVEHR